MIFHKSLIGSPEQKNDADAYDRYLDGDNETEVLAEAIKSPEPITKKVDRLSEETRKELSLMPHDQTLTEDDWTPLQLAEAALRNSKRIRVAPIFSYERVELQHILEILVEKLTAAEVVDSAALDLLQRKVGL